MPVKKGTKKKKSSKKKTTSSEKDDINKETMDPGSVMSGTQTDPLLASGGKKKKKLKKKKLSKSEKALEKLEKACQKIRDDEEQFERLIGRMDQWLIAVAPRAISLFKRMDASGDGSLTYEEFKSGMFDLNVPLNQTELHLFAKLLDKDESGEIDYTEFSQGIKYVKPVEESASEQVNNQNKAKLILTEKSVGAWEPYREKKPRYLLIELRLVTFDTFKEHLGHFTCLVYSHLTVYGLIEIIINQTCVMSTKLGIFTNKSRSVEALLPVDSQLDECGYFGGTKENPQEITLYYDYTVEFTDCPILLCDHYFGQKIETK